MMKEDDFSTENIIFDWKFYLVNSSELNDKKINKKDAVIEYFKKNDENVYDIITNREKNKWDLGVKETNHMLFRYICCNYLSLIRILNLPDIPKESIYEAVFIEYRCFPHIEFLIRNSIYRLGKEWSHTIICGKKNYHYIFKLVNKISPNIRIVKTNNENLTVTEYNKLLTSIKFWEKLKGEKILIYQEDSFIFKNNIKDFMKWDYIGAPLPLGTNDTPNCVGNGGLSLRTRSIMIEILKQVSPIKTNYNSSTIQYMKDNNLKYPPEDVFFSKNMQELNIGQVADWNSASEFSSESYYNKNSFGGHKFWISNENWIQHVNECISFKKYESNSDVEKYIIYKKRILPSQLSINLNVMYGRHNHFDIDFLFYKTVNKINIASSSVTELCYHFNNFGIYGMIYHPKQLLNIYPNIKIYNFYDKVVVKNEEKFYESNVFVNKKVYNKSFDEFKEMTLFKIDSLNFTNEIASPLLLLVFMGNIQIGKELVTKIIHYSKTQEFSIAFCFNSFEVMEHFKETIEKNFNHYIIYKSNEYGTDITSSLLMYYDISLKYKFKYVMKLHTKTIRPQFDELVNFLLLQPLENVLKLKTPYCNCIGNQKHYMSIVFQKNLRYDKHNKVLLEKYKYEFDSFKRIFVAGTIFLSESIVFDSVVKFMKRNNYHSFLLNNLYENNSVNMDNSPIHFLERLFGVIQLDYSSVPPPTSIIV
uniref:DUF5672 domain-containing protein n=1 Tax=viral metagenome TaxID=1070528 RepID=A0A6C0CVA4_9ZZZZ